MHPFAARAFLAILYFLGCAATAQQCKASEATKITLQEHAIAPSAADIRLQRFNFTEFSEFNPSKSNHLLLIYLPGTNEKPSEGMSFTRFAAELGYHSISVAYNNSLSIAQACRFQEDVDCSEQMIRKRLFGTGESDKIDDENYESVVARIAAMLQFLARNYSEEGWPQFLRQGNIEWSRVVFVGHSQGGTLGAYFAKNIKLNRVIVISGGADYISTCPEHSSCEHFAPWLSKGSATPLERWYAIYHQQEYAAPHLKVAFEQMGIAPDHIEVLDSQSRSGSRPHSSVPTDPRNQPTWRKVLAQRE